MQFLKLRYDIIIYTLSGKYNYFFKNEKKLRSRRKKMKIKPGNA